MTEPGALNDDEVKELRQMLQSYNRGRWLGRFIWKAIIMAGSIAAGVAAFKSDLTKLFGGGT
jgi:hypothetical protein